MSLTASTWSKVRFSPSDSPRPIDVRLALAIDAQGSLVGELGHHGHDRGVGGRLAFFRRQGVEALANRGLTQLPEYFHDPQLRGSDMWRRFRHDDLLVLVV